MAPLAKKTGGKKNLLQPEVKREDVLGTRWGRVAEVQVFKSKKHEQILVLD